MMSFCTENQIVRVSPEGAVSYTGVATLDELRAQYVDECSKLAAARTAVDDFEKSTDRLARIIGEVERRIGN